MDQKVLWIIYRGICFRINNNIIWFSLNKVICYTPLSVQHISNSIMSIIFLCWYNYWQLHSCSACPTFILFIFSVQAKIFPHSKIAKAIPSWISATILSHFTLSEVQKMQYVIWIGHHFMQPNLNACRDASASCLKLVTGKRKKSRG